MPKKCKKSVGTTFDLTKDSLIKKKPDQTLFDRTYWNLTSLSFFIKKLWAFQWLPKWKFPSFMTKVKPNKVNETKSAIFPWAILIGIFQFDCKREHKQVKWNKIKRHMSKSEIIFHYLQSNGLFQWLLKFISEKVHFKNEQQVRRENVLCLISSRRWYRKLSTFSRERFTTRSYDHYII